MRIDPWRLRRAFQQVVQKGERFVVFLGSNAAAVIRTSPVAVLLAR